MGVYRRGFALLLTLFAAAGVFALAMQAGVAARLAVVEAESIRAAAQERRDALAAALLSLGAMLDGAGASASALDGAAADSAQRVAEALEDPELPPLPPGLPIRDLLEQLQGETPEEAAESSSGASVSTDGRLRRRGALTALRTAGLPHAPLIAQTPAGSGSGAQAAARFRVRFIDAGGLVNVNTADEAQLAGVMLAVGIEARRAQALAQQLLDWRDEDSFVRPFGAEQDAYWRAGVTVRNGDLRSLAELAFLPAADAAALERLAPALTTAGDGAIHALTAPETVIASAPGMTPASAAQLIDARAAGELDEQRLRAILAPLGDRAREAFRLAPSGFVRAIVEHLDAEEASPGGGSVPYRVDFTVTENGVRDVRVRLAQAAPNVGATRP